MKKLFIPHEKNDHQPHILRDKAVKGFLAFTLLTEMLVLLLLSPVFSAKLDFLATIFPSALVSLTNESRVEKGVGTLKENELLKLAAQLKANDMARRGYFAHVTPDGKTPWYWIGLSGYQYEVAGENLAVHFIDSENVHRAWMNSPTHRANILRREFTEIGIATAEGEYEGRRAIFAVQFFGAPKFVSAGVSSASVVGNSNPNDVVAIADVNNEAESAVLGAVDDTQTEINDIRLVGTLVASPYSTLMKILYTVLVIISVALVLKIGIKMRIQHTKLIANGALLLVIVITFMYLNAEILSMYTKIG